MEVTKGGTSTFLTICPPSLAQRRQLIERHPDSRSPASLYAIRRYHETPTEALARDAKNCTDPGITLSFDREGVSHECIRWRALAAIRRRGRQ